MVDDVTKMFNAQNRWLKETGVLVEFKIVKEDVPMLVVVLEHFLECFYGLWGDSR